MIDTLYSPWPLFFAAAIFVAFSVALWLTRFRAYYLLLPATAFLLSAFEDFYMVNYSPETNIRIDALLFMFLIAVTVPLGVALTFLHRWPADRGPGAADGRS